MRGIYCKRTLFRRCHFSNKCMFVLLVTNLCSKACKTLGFFFCLFGGAKGSWAAGEKLSKFGEKAKKKEREGEKNSRVRSTSEICLSLPNYDLYFQNSLLEYQRYAPSPPPARPAAAKCSLRSVSFRCCCKTASVCSLLILCCCCLLVVVVVNRDGPTPRCCC